MKKALITLAAAASVFAVAPAHAAIIVNVDGIANASLTGASNTVDVSLAAGTYTMNFVSDLYTAFSRFSSSTGCTAGANCRQGWENSVRYIIDGTTYSFGDGNAVGGIGPIAGGGYFVDAATSFAHAATYSTQFTLTTDSVVKFFIYDDVLSDNREGVSLALTPAAVPEPATWAFMIAGFAAVGSAMRRRKTAVSFA